MSKIKVEVFLSIPACSGGIAVKRLIGEIVQKYGEQVEVVYHEGRDARFEELKLSSAPAIVVGDLVRIIGLCPTRQGLLSALWEAGLE